MEFKIPRLSDKKKFIISEETLRFYVEGDLYSDDNRLFIDCAMAEYGIKATDYYEVDVEEVADHLFKDFIHGTYLQDSAARMMKAYENDEPTTLAIRNIAPVLMQSRLKVLNEQVHDFGLFDTLRLAVVSEIKGARGILEMLRETFAKLGNVDTIADFLKSMFRIADFEGNKFQIQLFSEPLPSTIEIVKLAEHFATKETITMTTSELERNNLVADIQSAKDTIEYCEKRIEELNKLGAERFLRQGENWQAQLEEAAIEIRGLKKTISNAQNKIAELQAQLDEMETADNANVETSSVETDTATVETASVEIQEVETASETAETENVETENAAEPDTVEIQEVKAVETPKSEPCKFEIGVIYAACDVCYKVINRSNAFVTFEYLDSWDAFNGDFDAEKQIVKKKIKVRKDGEEFVPNSPYAIRAGRTLEAYEEECECKRITPDDNYAALRDYPDGRIHYEFVSKTKTGDGFIVPSVDIREKCLGSGWRENVNNNAENVDTVTENAENQEVETANETAETENVETENAVNTAAVNEVHDTDNAAVEVQPAKLQEVTRFEVGKAYYCIDASGRTVYYAVINRTEKTVTITNIHDTKLKYTIEMKVYRLPDCEMFQFITGTAVNAKHGCEDWERFYKDLHNGCTEDCVKRDFNTVHENLAKMGFSQTAQESAADTDNVESQETEPANVESEENQEEKTEMPKYNIITAERYVKRGYYVYRLNGKFCRVPAIENETKQALEKSGDYANGAVLLVDDTFKNINKLETVQKYIAANPDRVANLAVDVIPFINDKVSKYIEGKKPANVEVQAVKTVEPQETSTVDTAVANAETDTAIVTANVETVNDEVATESVNDEVETATAPATVETADNELPKFEVGEKYDHDHFNRYGDYYYVTIKQRTAKTVVVSWIKYGALEPAPECRDVRCVIKTDSRGEHIHFAGYYSAHAALKADKQLLNIEVTRFEVGKKYVNGRYHFLVTNRKGNYITVTALDGTTGSIVYSGVKVCIDTVQRDLDPENPVVYEAFNISMELVHYRVESTTEACIETELKRLEQYAAEIAEEEIPHWLSCIKNQAALILRYLARIAECEDAIEEFGVRIDNWKKKQAKYETEAAALRDKIAKANETKALVPYNETKALVPYNPADNFTPCAMPAIEISAIDNEFAPAVTYAAPVKVDVQNVFDVQLCNEDTAIVAATVAAAFETPIDEDAEIENTDSAMRIEGQSHETDLFATLVTDAAGCFRKSHECKEDAEYILNKIQGLYKEIANLEIDFKSAKTEAKTLEKEGLAKLAEAKAMHDAQITRQAYRAINAAAAEMEDDGSNDDPDDVAELVTFEMERFSQDVKFEIGKCYYAEWLGKKGDFIFRVDSIEHILEGKDVANCSAFLKDRESGEYLYGLSRPISIERTNGIEELGTFKCRADNPAAVTLVATTFKPNQTYIAPIKYHRFTVYKVTKRTKSTVTFEAITQSGCRFTETKRLKRDKSGNEYFDYKSDKEKCSEGYGEFVWRPYLTLANFEYYYRLEYKGCKITPAEAVKKLNK